MTQTQTHKRRFIVETAPPYGAKIVFVHDAVTTAGDAFKTGERGYVTSLHIDESGVRVGLQMEDGRTCASFVAGLFEAA